jgi:hypothetical protein
MGTDDCEKKVSGFEMAADLFKQSLNQVMQAAGLESPPPERVWPRPEPVGPSNYLPLPRSILKVLIAHSKSAVRVYLWLFSIAPTSGPERGTVRFTRGEAAAALHLSAPTIRAALWELALGDPLRSIPAPPLLVVLRDSHGGKGQILHVRLFTRQEVEGQIEDPPMFILG